MMLSSVVGLLPGGRGAYMEVQGRYNQGRTVVTNDLYLDPQNSVD